MSILLRASESVSLAKYARLLKRVLALALKYNIEE